MPYFNADSDADVMRLRDAIRESRRAYESHLTLRQKFLDEIEGKHSGRDSELHVPLNLLGLARSIYLRQLAAKNPRVMVRSENAPHLRPQAETIQILTNRDIQRMKLQRTLRRCFDDALSGIGAAKVGLMEDIGVVRRDSYGDPIRKYYYGVEAISPSNLVLDLSVNRQENAAFYGDRYIRGFKEVREDPNFDTFARSQVVPTDYAESYGDGAVDRMAHTGHPEAAKYGYREYVELEDVFLPDDGVLVTWEARAEGTRYPLRVQEIYAPETGVYHFVQFEESATSMLGLSTFGNLYDLHRAINWLICKLINQSMNQKTVPTARPSARDDVRKIQKSDGSTVIVVNNPDAIRELHFAGPDAVITAFVLQLVEWFYVIAGNLPALGGLGPQSPTLGQDQMIAATASEKIQDMQDRAVTFTRELLFALMDARLSDPELSERVTKNPPETSVSVTAFLTSANLLAALRDYEFEVDPYSMQDQSPQARRNNLMMMLNAVQPYLGILPEAGGRFNLAKLVKLFEKYDNQHDYSDVIEFPTSEEIGPGAAGAPHVRSLPANTTRTNVRVNRGPANANAPGQAIRELAGAMQQT